MTKKNSIKKGPHCCGTGSQVRHTFRDGLNQNLEIWPDYSHPLGIAVQLNGDPKPIDRIQNQGLRDVYCISQFICIYATSLWCTSSLVLYWWRSTRTPGHTRTLLRCLRHSCNFSPPVQAETWRSALAPAAVYFAHLLIWKYRKKSGLTGTPARKLFPTSPRHCALVISASHYAPDSGQCWCSLHGVTENDHEWANWWDLLKVYIFWMYSQLQCGDHLWIHIQGANLQSDSVLGRKFAVPRPQKIGTSNWVWLKPIITTFGGINIH